MKKIPGAELVRALDDLDRVCDLAAEVVRANQGVGEAILMRQQFEQALRTLGVSDADLDDGEDIDDEAWEAATARWPCRVDFCDCPECQARE